MTAIRKLGDEISLANELLAKPGQIKELVFLKEQFLELPVGSVVVKESAGGFIVADGLMVVEKKLVQELRGLLDDVQELEAHCQTCEELKELAKVVKWYMGEAA